MSKSKKYSYQVTKESDTCWSASIIRQVSSKKTNVSKTQSDFKTEEEATIWAKAELTAFEEIQNTQNSRKNEQRKANSTIRAERSSRKAAKTAADKAEAEKAASEAEKASESVADSEGFDDYGDNYI